MGITKYQVRLWYPKNLRLLLKYNNFSNNYYLNIIILSENNKKVDIYLEIMYNLYKVNNNNYNKELT